MNIKTFLSTGNAKRYLDVTTIVLICVAAVWLLASTYQTDAPWYQPTLVVGEILLCIAFFIEVSLRLWLVARSGEGMLGKYCCSALGVIDLLSAYVLPLCWIWGAPALWIQLLQIVRLLRIFGFLDAFSVLGRAIKNKRRELLLSLGLLSIVTFMLSLAMYFIEEAAHPGHFVGGSEPVVWAFMQYIEDPGGFAENPPITTAGRIISCIVGILGIAVFAVPAGLVGSAFIEEVEAQKESEKGIRNARVLESLFVRKTDRAVEWRGGGNTKALWRRIPPYLSLAEIQVKAHLTEEEVLNGIEHSESLRLINLASTMSIDSDPHDRLAVESFVKNRPYGCCIDRNSNVTICMTSSFVEPGTGNFGFYLALACGFNFISREVGDTVNQQSFFWIEEDNDDPTLKEFLADLKQLSQRPNAWTVCLLATEGGETLDRDTLVHFNCGGKRGDEQLESSTLTITDKAKFLTFYEDMSTILNQEFELPSDIQRYFGTSKSTNIMQRMKREGVGNIFNLRINYSVTQWNQQRLAVAQAIAHTLAKHFATNGDCTEPEALKTKGAGYQVELE